MLSYNMLLFEIKGPTTEEKVLGLLFARCIVVIYSHELHV